jgi:CRISPR-associated endonuclease/helicase Cas3
MQFNEFFQAATGKMPYSYQRRLAADTACRSQLISVPTGLGKTAAVVLAWLWRRAYCKSTQWPRRLVYCLPMRTLVAQTARVARDWLAKLRAAGYLDHDIEVYLLMGGEDDDDWDLYPEKDAILVGTQDMLLSRALNRGYGMSRYRWPMHFGLLHSDCLWVLDETQLMGVSVETSAQLDGFRHDKKWPVAWPCHTWWMSATLEPARLATIDHPEPPGGWPLICLDQDDRAQAEVSRRAHASKPLAKCDVVLSAAAQENYAKSLAAWALKQHQPNSLTLVVVNNVRRAQEIYIELKSLKPGDPVGLIHSRFRPGDREKHEKLLYAEGGRIIVSTQAVEAGVDVSARTLITELAPWSSLVQRFGRCNRNGEFRGNDARIFWVDIEAHAETDSEISETRGDNDGNDGNDGNDDSAALALPYTPDALNQAREALGKLKDASPAQLQRVRVAEPRVIRPVIRRKDLAELFDTTPDLAGYDLDISRYIRDGDDTDAQVFWRDLGGSQPKASEPEARRDELCRVALWRFLTFLKWLKQNKDGPKLRAYAWNQLSERWEPASPRAGGTYMLDTRAGGYSAELGWFGDAGYPADVAVAAPPQVGAAGYSENLASFQRAWVTLRDHTRHVVAETNKLLLLAPGVEETLKTAAQWHDVGKAHAVFQDALTQGEKTRAAELWAKSANPPRRCARKFFRHELASALAWLQAGPPEARERDLVAYLIAAHHGKVRLSIRALPGELPPPEKPDARLARGIFDGDPLGPVNFDGVRLPAVALDLALMEMGRDAAGRRSWLERTLELRGRFGPFLLAYWESLLRAADMRASALEALDALPPPDVKERHD